MKFVLHQRLHRKQHVAVRIIEQVQRREHEQRGAGIEFGRSHGSSEYSMACGQRPDRVFAGLTLATFVATIGDKW